MRHAIARLFRGQLKLARVPKLGIGINKAANLYFTPGDTFYDLAMRGFWSMPSPLAAQNPDGSTTAVGGAKLAQRCWPFASINSSATITEITSSADGQIQPDPITGAPRFSEVVVSGVTKRAYWHTVKMDRDGRIYKTNSAGATYYQFNLPSYWDSDRPASFILDFGMNVTVSNFTNCGTVFTFKDGSNTPTGKYRIFPVKGKVATFRVALDGNFPDAGLPQPKVLPELDNAGTVLSPAPLGKHSEMSAVAHAFQHVRWLDNRQVNGDLAYGDTPTSYAMHGAGEGCTNYAGGTINCSKFDISTILQLTTEMNAYSPVGLWYQCGHRASDAAIIEDLTKVAASAVPFVILEFSNETWNSSFNVYREAQVFGLRLGYQDANISSPSGAVARTVYAQPGAVNDANVAYDLPDGALYWHVIGGYGSAVDMAVGSKAAGSPPPILYSGSKVYNAGDCVHTSSSESTLKVWTGANGVSGVPTSDPRWQNATPANAPWVLVNNFSDCLRAQRRWIASRSKFLKQQAVSIFGAAGKKIPRIVLNTQMANTADTQSIIDKLSWDNFHLDFDAIALAPYFGAVGTDLSTGQKYDNISFGKSCPGWTTVNRAALYDTVVNGLTGAAGADAAVARAVDCYFTDYVAMVDAAIKNLKDARTIIYNWYVSNHPEVGLTSASDIPVWNYENNMQGLFTTGWPDNNANGSWSGTGVYTNYSANIGATNDFKTSYTKDSSGQLYRCIQQNVGAPLTDTSYWEPVPLPSSGFQRVVEFFRRTQTDPRIGAVHAYYDQQFKAQIGKGFITKYSSEAPLPTQPGGGNLRFGIRLTSDNNDSPIWQSCIVTKADYETQGFDA